jgi:hypothetical protein
MRKSELEDRIMSVFKGEKPDKIPWMPRIEHWYNVNRTVGTLPQEYEGLDLPQVYERLNAAMRLYIFADWIYGFLQPPYGPQIMPTPLKTVSGLSWMGREKAEVEEVEVKRVKMGNEIVTEYKTPLGVLKSIERSSEHGWAWYIVEYPVKSVKDFKVLEYLLERTGYEFDTEAFEKLSSWLRGQGMIWCCGPRRPLQRLLIEFMGVERTFISLRRHKDEVERIMEAIKQDNDRYYEAIKKSPIKVVNLTDNLDCRMVSPELFKKYYLPEYQERCDELHKAGKYVITHADGYVKALLPLFKETGLDGVEAVTFKPAGDVTPEEVKEAFGDELILVDGIPYWHFLPEVSMEEFEKITRKVIRMFRDRLILAISDEMPPPGEHSKLVRVAKIVEEES